MSNDHIRFGIGAIRAGCRVTLVLTVAALVYALATPHGPHREIIVAIVALALADGVAMWKLVPHERLARSGRLIPVLMAWNLVHVVAITTVATLDGGLHSPFVAMFFVSAVFAALTLPRSRLIAVSCWDAAGLVVVGLVGGHAEQLAIFVPSALVIGLLSATIAGELHRRIRAVEDAQAETIEKLARAVEYRDASTGGHIERMAAYARIVARRLGLSEHDGELLFRAGPLHDVGKIGVPDSVLLKPGALTAEERAVMERHAVAGYDLLADSDSELLRLGAQIALGHHERWDGGGYPRGLRGEEIPLPARIVAVADVFDALTTDRVYRPALSFDEAVAIVCEGRGSHFDPAVVDAFLAAVDEIAAVGGGAGVAPLTGRSRTGATARAFPASRA